MMEITLEWHGDQFNINLHGAPGAEPFLSIKGCRIKEGSKGQFISYPATKNQSTGKWFNHVYGGEKFNAHVMKLAAQQVKKPSQDGVKARQLTKQGSGFEDMDSDIPF